MGIVVQCDREAVLQFLFNCSFSREFILDMAPHILDRVLSDAIHDDVENSVDFCMR